jgi:hypothetical protein
MTGVTVPSKPNVAEIARMRGGVRAGVVPFQFDVRDALKKVQRLASKRIGSIALNLPFVSVCVNPKDKEKQVAREVVIRLKDRRVLSAWECCDDCVERALGSLQEIRSFLADKEVELSEFHDGPLSVLVEMMLTGIRQFLAFEQRLSTSTQSRRRAGSEAQRRFGNARQDYFDSLEILRGHLSRCLGQIALLAGIEMPSNGLIENYQGAWFIEAYASPLAEIGKRRKTR